MLFDKVRCHPSIIIYNSLRVVFLLLVGLGYILIDTTKLKYFFNVKNNFSIIVLAVSIMLFVTAFYVLLCFLAWRHTYVSVKSKLIFYDKNTFIFQKNLAINLSEIATVHLQKGIIDRLFDTVTVKLYFDIGSAIRKNNFRFVFRSDIAKDFVNIVLDLNGGDNDLSVVETLENQSAVVNFATSKILQHAIFITPIWGVIALGAALAGVTLPFVKLSLFWYPIVFLAGLPVAFFVAFITSVIRTFVRYYGFKLYKLKKELSVVFGLITHHTFVLPIKKTNAVILKQSVFGRIFGRYYVEVLQVGMNYRDKRVVPVLCLMLEKKQIEGLLHTCFSDIIYPFSFSHSPKTAYLPYCLKGAVFVALLMFGVLKIGELYPSFYFMTFIIVIMWVIISFAIYRAQGIKLTNKYLVVASGVLERRFLLVPYQKIQKISIRSGPISRLFGLQNGKVFILSDISYRKNRIGYFNKETFLQIIRAAYKGD